MNANLLLSGWGRRLGRKLMNGQRLGKPKVEIPTKWNIVRGNNARKHFPLWSNARLADSMWMWCAGDIVQVTQGPHSGQQGKILTVLRRKQRVVIDGVNMVRVHHLFCCC
jgi:hypothetical protein